MKWGGGGRQCACLSFTQDDFAESKSENGEESDRFYPHHDRAHMFNILVCTTHISLDCIFTTLLHLG